LSRRIIQLKPSEVAEADREIEMEKPVEESSKNITLAPIFKSIKKRKMEINNNTDQSINNRHR
jgi:hypothetical protein